MRHLAANTDRISPVPRYFTSRTMSADVAAAVQALGGALRIELIRTLAAQPGQTVTDIARSIDASVPTVQRALASLVDAGVVVSDLPDEERGRGRPVHYQLDLARTTALLAALLDYLPSEILPTDR